MLTALTVTAAQRQADEGLILDRPIVGLVSNGLP